MAKTLFYAVRNEHGLYLQGIEPNENYSHTGTAPTMGNRHTPTEFRSVWKSTMKSFEPLTLANYIKVILEEYRWETRLPTHFAILPMNEIERSKNNVSY